MSLAEAKFMNIVHRLSNSDENVHLGKMMSSPGLKFKDKVFAFYHKESMGFRLGENFSPEKYGVDRHRPLSPFKTKPPLKGWFIIDKEENNSWELLADLALDFTKTL